LSVYGSETSLTLNLELAGMEYAVILYEDRSIALREPQQGQMKLY